MGGFIGTVSDWGLLMICKKVLNEQLFVLSSVVFLNCDRAVDSALRGLSFFLRAFC